MTQSVELFRLQLRMLPYRAKVVVIFCLSQLTNRASIGAYWIMMDLAILVGWPGMETGSVILRGGDVDDILSRLARIKDDGTGPVLFWEWGSEEAQPSKPTNSTKSNEESKPNGLISSVRKCLQNDTYARDVSEEAVQFWSEYVERGQEVWDGYMAYLFVKQSQRFEMTLKEEEFTSFAVPPLFQSLSKSKMVCSVVSDIATPTGENGRPRWKYIRAGTAYLLITFCSSFVALSAILRKLRTSSSAHSHIY